MKHNYLNKLEDYLGIILVFGLAFLLAIQVIFRYVFSHPLGWTEELARYVFIWMIFVGAVIVSREREHVRIELLKTFVPEKAWQFLTFLNELCIFVFWVFLIPAAFKYAFFAINIDASGSGISMFFVFISLPICGLLIGIHTIINMVKDFKKIIEKENNTVTSI